MDSPHNRTTTFRLMVSTGGHILPRPHDKSLRYVGGETRMLTLDRHTTLSDLTTRLSKTIIKKSCMSSSTSSSVQFALKYQLPNEELDSLISVTTDEDMENMIDECERLSSGTPGNSASASRIRLFIFPKPNPNINSDLVSDIGLFLNNSSKSEDWFLNALNRIGSGFSDTSSMNCLLDLDDEILLPEKKIVNNSGHDVRSIPDSPMLETTSSFGSASSTPSQAPVNYATVVKEQSDPFFSFDEKTDQGLQMDYLKQHQQHSVGFDLSSVDLLLSDLTITDQSSPISQIQSSNHNNRAVDPNDNPDQNTQNPNSAYLTSTPTTQAESPRHQFHLHQPQYIPPPQYIHHHHPPMAVPVTSYYHHHPPTNQHNFMYYIPTTQPPQCHNFPLQQPQPSQADTRSVAPTKTDLPVYRTNSGGPQLVRIPSGYLNQPQHVGYSGIHQPSQSMYYATPLATSQQVRTGQQP